MKIRSLFLALCLSACARAVPQVSPTQPPSPTTASTATAVVPTVAPSVTPPTTDKPSSNPATHSLTTLFAQWTGESNEAIKLKDVRLVNWPNACLGVPRPDEVCAQVLVPGFDMTFEVGDQSYQIHSDATGDKFRVAQAPEPKIGTPIVEWSGSIDADPGACGHVVIGSEGIAFGDCAAPMLAGRFITPDWRGHLQSLAERYASFKTRLPIGSVAFNSAGKERADAATQRQIAEIAKQSFLEARAGRTSATATQAIQWQHSNANGNCEVVVVARVGEWMVFPCKGAGETPIRQQLERAQLTQLYRWIDTLALFSQEGKDSSADKPDILSLDGHGPKTATEQDYAQMRNWLETISQSAAALERVGFEAGLRENLVAQNFDTLERFMRDPFTIANWQSEGGPMPRAEAIMMLKSMASHKGKWSFEPYDAVKALQWPAKAEDGSRLVSSLRVKGWAQENARAEAVLFIYQQPNGSYIWPTLLVSRATLPN